MYRLSGWWSYPLYISVVLRVSVERFKGVHKAVAAIVFLLVARLVIIAFA